MLLLISYFVPIIIIYFELSYSFSLIVILEISLLLSCSCPHLVTRPSSSPKASQGLRPKPGVPSQGPLRLHLIGGDGGGVQAPSPQHEAEIDSSTLETSGQVGHSGQAHGKILKKPNRRQGGRGLGRVYDLLNKALLCSQTLLKAPFTLILT